MDAAIQNCYISQLGYTQFRHYIPSFAEVFGYEKGSEPAVRVGLTTWEPGQPARAKA